MNGFERIRSTLVDSLASVDKQATESKRMLIGMALEALRKDAILEVCTELALVNPTAAQWIAKRFEVA